MNRERVEESDFRKYQDTKKRYRPVQLWRIASLGNIPLGIVKVIAANERWFEEKFGKKEASADGEHGAGAEQSNSGQQAALVDR